DGKHLPLHRLQRRVAARHPDHGESQRLQRERQRLPDRLVVLDDERARRLLGGHLPGSSPTRGTAVSGAASLKLSIGVFLEKNPRRRARPKTACVTCSRLAKAASVGPTSSALTFSMRAPSVLAYARLSESSRDASAEIRSGDSFGVST